MTQKYPKRLIEVDLPIKRISAHARREKSIRHGHLSTLHIWWARRPLAACRAVICASLWPDPADPLCPQRFRDEAAKTITQFARSVINTKALGGSCDPQTWVKWQTLVKKGGFDSHNEAHWNLIRFALLDFIADFANWDNSTVVEYLETSRALTEMAHVTLGGQPGTRPLVVDPFAGGGSIPLEALRVGADAFASDLNPVAVILNKVLLEYIPKYGDELAKEVRRMGRQIKLKAEEELSAFYPINDSDGATSVAYLWARTIECEGPACGVTVPLIRSLWLAKRPTGSLALQLIPNLERKRIDFRIIVDSGAVWADQDNPAFKVEKPTFDGTVKRGSATCPCCGYTTRVERVREQLKLRQGGTDDAQLMCVVSIQTNVLGRLYRLPATSEMSAVEASREEIKRRRSQSTSKLSLIPDEVISLNELRRISLPLYGMKSWGDMFTARQQLALTTVCRFVAEVGEGKWVSESSIPSEVTATLLALVVDRLADSLSSSVTWTSGGEFQGHTFTRQALAFVSDFAEVNPWCDSSGNWMGAVEWVSKVCDSAAKFPNVGHVERGSAAHQLLPDDCADAVVTDPPYYDAVPYAHLSDFFYVWLKRSIGRIYPEFLSDSQVPKEAEIVVDRPHFLSNSTHDITYYEHELTKAFSESRRILFPNGIALIVFASKTTASWEAILKAVVEAGWVITGSWPIDTEREARMAAQGQARLASSIHLVCRPRERSSGLSSDTAAGDWRDVLQELPLRIHDWMPRLADEGVVGADAIFACLGPALEVFSRYSRVEKANGETVTLREYLEHVWAAVSKEALALVFEGADATGFEADARLTAMWLWTLKAPESDESVPGNNSDDDLESDQATKKSKAGGFKIEYDAARKIAQGLGANLDSLINLVEVTGDEARLFPVSERTRHLFGKDEEEAPRLSQKKKGAAQLTMFAELVESPDAEAVWKEKTVKRIGETTLDRIHQAMILFAAGRGEALKRFIVEDGVGQDGKFWRLAQALSALYPSITDEKRWVDGVLARKKQFGF